MNYFLSAILSITFFFHSFSLPQWYSSNSFSERTAVSDFAEEFPGIARMSDFESIQKKEYDFLLLSMVPTSTLAEDNFSRFRYVGCPEYNAGHQFTTLYDLTDFLNSLDPLPPEIYIFLDLSAVSRQYPFLSTLYLQTEWSFFTFVEAHPETQFSFILPYYSLQYLQSLNDIQSERLEAVYSHFMELFFDTLPNVQMFYLGTFDWLVGNPSNYASYNYCHLPLTSLLLNYIFTDDSRLLTADNIDEYMEHTHDLVEGGTDDPLLSRMSPILNRPSDVSVLTDTDIIFFGDSVIGNYTSSYSIPGVVAGLTGAKVYNLGIGGTSACGALYSITDSFLSMNTEAVQSTNAEIGLKKYIADHKWEHFPRKKVFIINYGLNDYFNGCPLGEIGSYDPTTYTGALDCAVKMLKEAYPDCKIIINTPNFCSIFSYGSEEHNGYTLADYVQATIDTASEMGVDCIDTYYSLGINSENCEKYILDSVHPNELGMYVIGKKLADFLIQNQ